MCDPPKKRHPNTRRIAQIRDFGLADVDIVTELQWTPGRGPDRKALARLCSHFPKPAVPMGEAWFLGEERVLFTYLVDNDASDLPAKRLVPALEEITSGTVIFGPLPEWAEWYHYLLGQLIPRGYEFYVDYLVEYLVSGFICQYPDGIKAEPYPGFQSDVLATLAVCNMDAALWHGRDIRIGRMLHQRPAYVGKSPEAPRRWGWQAASSDFSAQMVFCLKYLPQQSIGSWVRSFLSIPSPHWAAQVMVWLLGARRFLEGEISQPNEFPDQFDGDEPQIDWAWSHCFKGACLATTDGASVFHADFVGLENLKAFRAAIAAYVDHTLVDNWMKTIGELDYLKIELDDLPERFRSIYLAQQG